MGVFSLLCHGTTTTGMKWFIYSEHVWTKIMTRYCIPIDSVPLIILQRRRRIDRSMIGLPTNFKVSTLLSSFFMLFHKIYSNELWLSSQHTGHIGSGDMASGSDVSWLKTLPIFLIEALFLSFDIDSRIIPFKSFIYVRQLTKKWT